MSWTKLPPLPEPGFRGCLYCGHNECEASLDMVLAVGFGDCVITRDGEEIYSESAMGTHMHFGDYPTLAKYEAMAAEDPDHDWRCPRTTPLYESVWQRQGSGEWLLVKTGRGFA